MAIGSASCAKGGRRPYLLLVNSVLMEFIADLSQLGAMLDLVRTFFKDEKLSDQAIYKIELAAEEAIVNVISYAYQIKSGNEKLEIDCRKIAPNLYEIVVTDRGSPFNPLNYNAELNLNSPICERKIGGLGIYLMRQLASEIIYNREADKNILKMIFKPATQS